MSVAEGYSSVTGRKIWYRVQGEAGPRVVFVMGFAMRGHVWERQVQAFRDEYQCAYFDHAGLGNSGELTGRTLTMRDMADDVLGLMDTLGWHEDVHLVGISMGGMIAQHVAVRAYGRLKTLTLAATTAGGFPNIVPPSKGLRLFLEANGAKGPDRHEVLGQLLYSPRYWAESREDALRTMREDFVGPEPPRTTRLAHLSAVLRHDVAGELGKLRKLPTLIIKPTEDVLISPRQCDRLAGLMPHARLVAIEAGHGVTREAPDAFNGLLREHFERA